MKDARSSGHQIARSGSNPPLNTARPPLQRKREGVEDNHRSPSSRDLRLRQNYIINRDHAYTSMQGQFNELATKPQFNRFISLKKSPPSKNQQHIARQIVRSHEGGRRREVPFKNRLRQRILFQKLRRPEHNSPIRKTTIRQLDTESTRAIDQGDSKKNGYDGYSYYMENEQDNSMMLKQMVTRMEDSRAGRIMPFDPYTPRNKDNYYIAEAIKGYQDRESLVRDHLFNSIYFLELLDKYNNTSDFAEDKPINLPQHPKYKGKITVVFDLDETLVHCFQELDEKHQVEIPVTFPGGHSMLAPVNIRPYAKEIIQELAKDFELMVFTASHQAYANAVIDYLDPKRECIQHRLYRRHCDYIEQGYYVKDLRLLGRDLSRVVIVDNAAYSYAFQVSNGIPIISYYQGQTDYQLRALKEYILSLSDFEDVRESNQRTFKLSRYITFTTVDQLVQQLYLGK